MGGAVLSEGILLIDGSSSNGSTSLDPTLVTKQRCNLLAALPCKAFLHYSQVINLEN